MLKKITDRTNVREAVVEAPKEQRIGQSALEDWTNVRTLLAESMKIGAKGDVNRPDCPI